MLLPEGTPDEIVEVLGCGQKNGWWSGIQGKATTALGPFPLIIGEEAGEIVKKTAVFSDNTKDQLNAALKMIGLHTGSNKKVSC